MKALDKRPGLWAGSRCEGIVEKKIFQIVLDKALGLRYNGRFIPFSIVSWWTDSPYLPIR